MFDNISVEIYTEGNSCENSGRLRFSLGIHVKHFFFFSFLFRFLVKYHIVWFPDEKAILYLFKYSGFYNRYFV